MENDSVTQRRIKTIIAVVTGLLMISLIPIMIQTSVERVVNALIMVSEERPAFSSGVTLFTLFYPLWRAILFVGGTALLVIAPSIWKGEKWTYPTAMFLYALPSIAGMFMTLPYVSFVEGFPLPMPISWIGLAGFWSSIFLRKVEAREKWAQFLALTFIGMLSTHAFVIGIGAQRMLLTRPGKPLYEGLEWWILTMSGEINWICVVLLIASIPLLAAKRVRGWWLAVTASFAILAINVPTQIIRTSTLDYLYGSIIAIGVLVFTMLPTFKGRLIGKGGV
ncbi:MAG: hypothetical protein PVF83_05815 [Anaerolineales bacterium]|jgi:hypothetical protein